MSTCRLTRNSIIAVGALSSPQAVLGIFDFS